jgi:hypothetical protein
MLKRIEVFIGHMGMRLTRVANFLYFFQQGRQNKYPICCIIHFSWDRAIKQLPPAIMRGTITICPEKVYVPCKFHIRRHLTWKSYNAEPRIQLRLFSDEIGKL